MTTQVAVKLSDSMAADLDDLVSSGRFDSRSAAVRAGLELLRRQELSDTIDRAFVQGFRCAPETAEEMRDAQRLAVDAIDDEPWDRWW